MDDEFALCWNNFQENIASGFQNLFDRGDLVDVTLACDGKLLQAHKIVLAICSPYFQEMFITNPCRHPIIVLKDVSYTVMTELLQFMYQGVVNVKHTELNSFMKIAQQLQIKGLATSSSNQQMHPSQAHHHSQKSPSSPAGSFGAKNENYPNAFHSSQLSGHKRAALDYSNLHNESGGGSGSSKKHLKRTSESVDNDVSTESMDNLSTSEDGFPIPQISMIESGRFDLSNVKRETGDSPGATRNLSAPFNFDYNRLANASAAGSSASTINANHMEIPTVTPGEKWCHGKLEFMLSQRGKPLLVHDGHSFGIQYIRKDKKYWQCNLSRKFNCKARVTTTDTGEIIVTNNEHCHTEIRQHLKKDYKNKLMLNALSHFNHHLNNSILSGNGPIDVSNNNNNLNNNNNSSSNENARARSSSPQISSNGSWNLKKESN
ncbi:protein abrupt-like isoform X2 [Contarinia nasturtii]|uniref:protein abrupt-like isoform X2 n=1 Tax=Contarinia nasturtii TaxID=265458 RepID=UPI0012D4B142|nr:protein abrupt-like isoform X2 [Contarinia nasturtii]